MAGNDRASGSSDLEPSQQAPDNAGVIGDLAVSSRFETRQPFAERVQVFTAWLGAEGRWPSHYSDNSEERRLCRWADSQRARYAADLITPEEIGALEAVPGWRWRPGHAGTPTVGFKRLEQMAVWLRRTGGVYPSPGGTARKERLLAAWVQRQRRDHRDGSMTTERREALAAVPRWVWDPAPKSPTDEGSRDRRTFEQSHAEVMTWIRNAGSPPRRSGPATTPQEYRLAAWLSAQRSRFYAGKLSPERETLMKVLLSWDHLLNGRGQVSHPTGTTKRPNEPRRDQSSGDVCPIEAGDRSSSARDMRQPQI